MGLIEARPPPSLETALGRGSPDPRVYSLAPSSVDVLKEIGVWDGVRSREEGGEVEGVLRGRSQAFRGMQVCARSGRARGRVLCLLSLLRRVLDIGRARSKPAG